MSHGYTVSAAPRVCTSRASLVHCAMRKGVVSLAFGQNCLGWRASSSYISLRIPARIFTRAEGCTPCRVGLNADGLSFTAACLCYRACSVDDYMLMGYNTKVHTHTIRRHPSLGSGPRPPLHTPHTPTRLYPAATTKATRYT